MYFKDTKLNIAEVVLPVHERAVRNCPWVVSLWCNYLKALVGGLEPFHCVIISTSSPLICINYLTIGQRGRVVYEQIVNEGEAFF